nr:hypothetical protein BaRGS_017745 [Batillaria attramentaria]
MSGFLSAKSALSNGHHVEFLTPLPPYGPSEKEETKGFGVAVRSALCGCTNLHTHRGRRNNALLILTIAILPVVALVIQNAVFVQNSNAILTTSVKVKDDVLFSIQSGTVVHYMQIERGTSALYISSTGDANVLKNLQGFRDNTDRAIESLTLWVGSSVDGENFVSRDKFHQSIRDFRELVTNVSVTVPENVAFYSNFIAVMIGWLADSIQISRSGDLWPVLVRYHMLIISKEQAGVERALGSTFFATACCR